MADPIDFYFDFASSYSYIGQHTLRKLAEEHGREVRWKPVALGANFKALGSAFLLAARIDGRPSKIDGTTFEATRRV